MSYGYNASYLTGRATYNQGQEGNSVTPSAPPAPSVPSSYHAGYTLPSAPSGGASDPRLAAWLDEQEAAKERRAKRRKRQRRKQKREAEKLQNQPWFYPTLIGAGTLLAIVLAPLVIPNWRR